MKAMRSICLLLSLFILCVGLTGCNTQKNDIAESAPNDSPVINKDENVDKDIESVPPNGMPVDGSSEEMLRQPEKDTSSYGGNNAGSSNGGLSAEFPAMVPGAHDAKAWYEVDNGKLYIRTNIDRRNLNEGCSGTLRLHFSDGSYSHDNQGSYGEDVSCSVSILSHESEGTTVKQADYLVFDTYAFAYNEFWPLYRELDDFEAAVNACAEHLVARFVLDTSLTVADRDETLTLQSFAITYDDTRQKETYEVVLQEPLVDNGEYSLHYRTNSASKMSVIFKSGDKLSFTRNSGHFSDVGTSGSFWVSHAIHKIREDGSIVCEKVTSTLCPYEFEEYAKN